MESEREELRAELLAMLHAAPELPQDDRASLADVFLDKLQADYEVVPRGRTKSVRAPQRERTPIRFADWSRLGARFGALLLIVTVLWMTVLTSGSTHWHHPSLFPLVILFFVAMRFLRGRPGDWRRYSSR
jgi:hypothetical protein